MEDNQNKTLIGIGIAIIILLLLGTVGFAILNSKNKRNLTAEKLTTENLVSEKQQIQQELDKLANDLAALQAKNEAAEKTLAETRADLANKERRLANVSRQVNTLTKDQTELVELQKVKEELDNSYTELKSEYEEQLARNTELQNSITALEAEKTTLASSIEEMTLYDSDNFMVYGSRGKKREKLTFRAFWTKKLNMNFEVPQSLTENISFRMTTPTGTLITPENSSLSWIVLPDPDTFTASLSSVSGEFEPSRQVVLTYDRKERLEKGEYKIQILCNDNNIGNCRVRLK
ncbi:MAG: hypothetical protein JXN62_08960 [Bacteroidales bacterium]|nr:hypothetical protein [Bacteroidales bacterium]